MFDCIFTDQPQECMVCMDSMKLQCLLNKKHLRLKADSELKLVKILSMNCNSIERAKLKSGEAGRK